MDVRSSKKVINIFNGVLDRNCDNVVTIWSVLKAIKEGRWKEEVEWYRQETDKTERENVKKQFPAVTFSGLFKDRRLDKNIEYHTGILIVDIDKKDMTMTYEKTLNCVKKTPFIFAAFESPSHGIKALAWVDDLVINHVKSFKGVEEYFMDEYGIVIDKSGKNPSRLCFISYDPELYYEPEGKRIFNLETDGPKTFVNEKSKDYEELTNVDLSKYVVCNNTRHVMDVAKKRAVKGIGNYQKGNRNNYIFYLSCIMNRAGIDMDSAIDILHVGYPSLGLDETNTTVKSAYKRYPEEFGTKPILVKDRGQNSML